MFVLFIEGYHDQERPANIPLGWTIYNAPRPILGHKTWQGDFRHGIFYAAVAGALDTADEGLNMSAAYHRRNRQLDGHICKWISKAEILAYGQAKATEYEIDLADFDYSDIVDSFVQDYQRKQS